MNQVMLKIKRGQETVDVPQEIPTINEYVQRCGIKSAEKVFSAGIEHLARCRLRSPGMKDGERVDPFTLAPETAQERKLRELTEQARPFVADILRNLTADERAEVIANLAQNTQPEMF